MHRAAVSDGRARAGVRWLLRLGLALAVGAAAGVALVEWWPGAGGRSSTAAVVAGAGEASGEVAAEPLPEATLDGLGDGPPVTVAEYRGTPLLVNFWASWCPPCVTEMPELEALSRALDGRVAFLGVNVQDAPANALAFAEELRVTYELADDPSAEFFEEIGGFGLPTTLLVDADGTVVYRHVGVADRDTLADLIGDHLGVHVVPPE